MRDFDYEMDEVPMQLPMFVDPTTVVEETINGRWASIDYVTDDESWESKLTEAIEYGGHGTYGAPQSDFEHINEWAVFKPITVVVSPYYPPTLGNGHHRVAAAEATGMEFIPVVWDANNIFAGYESQDEHLVEQG